MFSEESGPDLVREVFWEDLDDGYYLSSGQSLRNSEDSQFVFLASPKVQIESRFGRTPVSIGAPFVLAEKIQAVLSSFEIKNGIRTAKSGIDYRCDWEADSADCATLFPLTLDLLNNQKTSTLYYFEGIICCRR